MERYRESSRQHLQHHIDNDEMNIDDISDSFGEHMVWVPQKKSNSFEKKLGKILSEIFFVS